MLRFSGSDGPRIFDVSAEIIEDICSGIDDELVC